MFNLCKILIEVERSEDITMQITKKEIIQKLYDIEETNNLKLGKEVQRVIRSEIIPMDIIKLINKYDKEFLQIYDTYNTIYMSRFRNPLYRNLKNKNLDIREKAIALSSLVTKILISCSKISDDDERQLFSTVMDVEGINRAITDYALYNDKQGILKCSTEVRELLEILYND